MKEKKANIAVLVSGTGTNLQAIIDAQKSGVIKSGEIKLVISNKKDAYAITRAQDAGIKTTVITKQEYGEEFENRITEVLNENSIDLIVLAGFMVILTRRFTETFKNRIINVHPSLIPSFCGEGFYGLRVHKAALRKGVKVTGATVHFVNEIPDGGEIIEQKAVRVYPGDTPEKLQKRVMRQAEWKILPKAVETISERIIDNEHL